MPFAIDGRRGSASTVSLPKGLFAALKRRSAPICVSPLLVELASASVDTVYARLGSGAAGLSADQAAARLAEHGPNVVAADGRKSVWLLLWHAFINPLVLLLAALATISFATGDLRSAVVMSLMIVLGVSIRLIQEAKADHAAAKLKAMISVTAAVLRDGELRELAVSQLVAWRRREARRRRHDSGGRADRLRQGPVRHSGFADRRIVSRSRSSRSTKERRPSRRWNSTTLRSWAPASRAARRMAVVVATGRETYLGSMAETLAEQPTQTAFDRGVARFTWLMLRFMAGHGAVGVRHQLGDQGELARGVLLRAGRRGRADARNAADDRDGLPVERAPWRWPARRSSSSDSTPFRISARWTSSARTRRAR